MAIKISIIKSGYDSLKRFGHNVSYGKKCGDIYNILDGTKSPAKRVVNITKAIFETAGKPISNTVIQDVTSARFVVRDTRAAYQTAINTAKTNNLSTAQKAAAVSSKVYKDGIKPHLPGTLGLAGTFVPLPVTQPIGYIVGKILQILF